MIEFKSEEEKEAWILKNAQDQIEWEKSLTWFNRETGKDEPTQQALNPRNLETGIKIARHQLWFLQQPENPLKAKYFKIRGGISIQESMLDDYKPILSIHSIGKCVYITNCKVEGREIDLLYEGKPDNVPKDLIDKLLCTGDSSYNPLRPFRWYRTPKFATAICVNTNDEADIDTGRTEALNSYLAELDDPDFVTIFEI